MPLCVISGKAKCECHQNARAMLERSRHTRATSSYTKNRSNDEHISGRHSSFPLFSFCKHATDCVYTRTKTRSVSGFGSRTHAKWKSRSTGGLSNRVEFLRLYTKCEGVEAIDTHHCLESKVRDFFSLSAGIIRNLPRC